MPVIVKGDVEVGTDKDALALGFSLGAEVGKAEDVHGLVSLICYVRRILGPAYLRAQSPSWARLIQLCA
jgi:hypothetical protein